MFETFGEPSGQYGVKLSTLACKTDTANSQGMARP